jgi:DNA-binding CsgD family transcriptional regulator
MASRNGKVLLKKIRDISKLPRDKKSSEEKASNQFVFCEKRSGLAQFQAASESNLECTIERMASTLAMQCLVRGSEPDDFEILVPVEKVLANRLESRAKQLLNEGRAIANPASLSPRQREILHSILCNHANKEIANKLNITVRTVKFHISTLLSKFGAENRLELARRASGFLRTTMHVEDGFRNPSVGARHEDLGPIPVDSQERGRPRARAPRLSQQRILTA